MSLLSLDSPRWLELGTSAGPGARTAGALRDALASRLDDRPWDRLYDLVVHQGTVYPATYAVLPHVLAAAGDAPASFWIDIGYLVSAIDSRAWHDVPRDLVPACDAAIAAALPHAIGAFDRARDARVPSRYWRKPTQCASLFDALALACIALARHEVGQLLWEFVSPPRPNEDFVHQMFCHAVCPACDIELEWMHCGDGILEYSLGKHDPAAPDRQPPFLAPAVPILTGAPGPWASIARSLEAATGATDRGAGANGRAPHRTAAAELDAIGAVACAVASAGVPRDAPNRAVICLVAAMIALHGERDWAWRFARLASDMRCPACDAVSAFVACLPALG